ncbi:hypothetical protein TNCV_7551 [Trichonephila clavipes]|nr:hypothetical protein TNCV_7551 [Trichonephila clavipes]
MDDSADAGVDNYTRLRTGTEPKTENSVNMYRLAKDSFKRQAMAYNLHFMFAALLRLYFVFNGKLITEELSSLQRMHSKHVACSQKSLKSWILIGSILGYITAFISICCMFWDKSGSVERFAKFYMLDLDIPEPYEEIFSVLSITIICVNPILIFIGQDLAVVFICSVYQKLGCFISDSAQVLAVSYSEAIPTTKSVHSFLKKAQNEIAVVPDFNKRILFNDEAHFWLNDYVNKQNCRIWSEANPQVYVETPLHPEKLTVWCALWAGGILLQKR